jgi:hypothetical protein
MSACARFIAFAAGVRPASASFTLRWMACEICG